MFYKWEDNMHYNRRDILRAIMEAGEISLSELARRTGYSRSGAWKRVMKLAEEGLVEVEKRGKILVVRPSPRAPSRGIILVGILRAAEYPYIIPLLRKLKGRYENVYVKVYDDPYLEVNHLISGKLHLAMAPLPTLILAHRVSGGRVHIIGGGSGGGAGIVRSRIDKPYSRGHATTMASSMEYCAEKHGLEPPRIYASSGEEILYLVVGGRVKAAPLWEPYLSMAMSFGLKVEPCDLEVCCLLGANSMLEGEYERISRMMEDSVSEAMRRLGDPVLRDSLSSLTGLPRELVERSMASYRFYENPPVDILYKSVDTIRRVIVPGSVVKDVVRA